ncbi:TIGR00282 family metallophosphoesterase [Roseimaritima sediminicola]|uniref:TIGR00282 family metallophosphoesterase n=1 Tax=Roseimaritima sediminicola TaxID=2662066 RepID=UPI0012983A26|nr:TIGR00282 family metallophosphoesterase [Roseimaritima sediminicola]
MRILFLGDIVGKPGMSAIKAHLRDLRTEHRLDLVIANAENAADGSGLTVRQFDALIRDGVDAITMGDHVYRKREIYPRLESDRRIVRPANYPASAPGKPWTTITAPDGTTVAIFALLGRVHTRPVDCPFAAADRVLEELPAAATVKIVDVHAEATSDKQLLGRYLDGRVSAVLGTHTHVPTADAAVLPGGTAFQCDVGMTGPYDSIIGRSIERVLKTTISFEPVHYHVATGDVRLCGALVHVDPASGRCESIERFEHRAEA